MGRKKARSQPSRRSPSGQSSLTAQKRRILGSPDWITKGLAFCNFHGPWSAWEQRLLKELSPGQSHYFDLAVKYSRDVLKRPWPGLEPMLVRLVHGPDLMRVKSAEFRYFVQYTQYHNGSPTLKNTILAQGSPAAAFAYAAYGTRRRWPNAEALILSGDTAARPALSAGVGDILDASQWVPSWESQAVTYARLFLPGGWPDLEHKMGQGECHPQVAYEYAEKVLRGPLPPPVEVWMTIGIFDAQGNAYRKKYFASTMYKKGQPSMGNLSSPPP